MEDKLKSDVSSEIAQLHTQGISSGFISSLGQKFVSTLYEAIAEDENSFGFVSVENDKVVGFVAFSSNLSGLYKYAIKKNGLKFMVILIPKILSMKTIRKIWDNIFYPKKMKKENLPDAELLSIVVKQQYQGKGIAKKLIDEGLKECKRRGIDRFKVLVSANNEPANKLYQKCGFQFHSKINSHGVESNIYICEV